MGSKRPQRQSPRLMTTESSCPWSTLPWTSLVSCWHEHFNGTGRRPWPQTRIWATSQGSAGGASGLTSMHHGSPLVWLGAAMNFSQLQFAGRLSKEISRQSWRAFWFLGKAGGTDWKERRDELESALRLRASNVGLHESGPGSELMRLRCHAAVPLNEVRTGGGSGGEAPSLELEGWGSEERPLRPDEVRRAFNTPFWPHVLVTTSIGQEGLDFHPWCRVLAHWDLCSGPVALEQREGRINRFAAGRFAEPS